jgi:3-oxoacyl-[acyl-carrier protein] reductase
MFDLTGKVALVTGGSRGIGRAIAIGLAEQGARVAVNYASNAAAADEVVQQIASGGGEAIAIQGDVSRADDAKRIVEETIAKFGALHILVNNAGQTADDLLLRMSEEAWDRVMAINLRGPYLCTKAALRSMIRQRWGRIINVSSVAGLVGNPGQANYAAAKAGLLGFTKSVAKEVASRNVTCNAIAPGLVKTEMTANLTEAQQQAVLGFVPLGRWATPEEIAPSAVFLASEEAGYITGAVLTIDGGLVMH